MLLCCWGSTGAPPLLSTDMLATCQQGIHSTLIMFGLTHAQPLHEGDAKVSTVTTWTGLGTADWPMDKMCKVAAVKSISARGATSRIWIPAILALEHRRHRRLVREVCRKKRHSDAQLPHHVKNPEDLTTAVKDKWSGFQQWNIYIYGKTV